MLVDLRAFQKALSGLPEEETVDSSEVHPYLLNEIFRPILTGKSVCYGDIDFSEFDADDLSVISDYCDRRESMMHKLWEYVNELSKAVASACTGRAFC